MLIYVGSLRGVTFFTGISCLAGLSPSCRRYSAISAYWYGSAMISFGSIDHPLGVHNLPSNKRQPSQFSDRAPIKPALRINELIVCTWACCDATGEEIVVCDRIDQLPGQWSMVNRERLSRSEKE